MYQRTLGKSGLLVSEIGLGCWQLGNDFGAIEDGVANDILTTAYQQGITFFDTADVYGVGLSEERIGKWRRAFDTVPVIATKVGRNSNLYPNGYSKASIKESLADSAKRLGVEALDLAQLHCVPRDVLFDGDIIAWMEDLQKEGLIKHFGASVEMLDEALFCCESSALTSLQILFNVFRQDATTELFPIAAQNDVGIIVRLPLASGLLSGNMTKARTFEQGDHRNYNRDGAAFHVGETFNGIPYELGVDLAEQAKDLLPEGMELVDLALRWILDHPQVSSVIAGSTKASQVLRNVKASGLPPLSVELHQQLATFYKLSVRHHIRGGI
ncbi:aldo/keto reductase [Marinomonas balearica]|uniref:Aryl-alcohol dehydrogenase-like predicted oxidoreductase n=1 Tax=Marinomonas balearica TaxID=491947 RepID=A0A4R6M958_9GAMM|nr:aldo/keto reductase [Marinomonas balearica]TDO97953.1 aryl-alcohol dehydrogenase-like predicted oxidoreductase [Marinomonas balearica]